MNDSTNKILEFVVEQKCIPWFLIEKGWLYFCIISGWIACLFKEQTECTFLIPHRNCSNFIMLSIESIERNCEGIKYKIIVADDASNVDEFYKIKIKFKTNKNIEIYRFKKLKSHPFILEWLYHRAKSIYVIILDQDSILISEEWKNLINEFVKKDKLMLIGIRDNRDSFQMVHPSFILMNKVRINRFIKPPFFYGERPHYERYRIGQSEPQHAISCKALAFSPSSLDYLDTYRTKYALGTVGYYQTRENAIVYHQWYSGRIFSYKDDVLLDGFVVGNIKKGINEFINAYSANSLDLTPENYCQDAKS